MEACLKGFGKMCKSLGKGLDSMGVKMEGRCAVVEELLPSSRVECFKHHAPKVSKASFIAPTATVSGDAILGENSSLWYGSTIRADVASVRVGNNTHLRDNVVVHVDSPPNQIPAIIGNNCYIDNGSIIHACTIDDNCLIGEGVTVLDGAHICEGAAIAPGSVVTPRKTVGSGEVWAGVPARKIRDLTAEEKKEIQQMCEDALKSALNHFTETSKSYEQVMIDAADAEDRRIRDITNPYNPNPNTVHPERRGLIYDRLPPEMDEPDDTPAVVPRPDARELQDLSYDVVATDEEDFAKLPHLPDHELKAWLVYWMSKTNRTLYSVDTNRILCRSENKQTVLGVAPALSFFVVAESFEGIDESPAVRLHLRWRHPTHFLSRLHQIQSVNSDVHLQFIAGSFPT